jgi:hypothetical protein
MSGLCYLICPGGTYLINKNNRDRECAEMVCIF